MSILDDWDRLQAEYTFYRKASCAHLVIKANDKTTWMTSMLALPSPPAEITQLIMDGSAEQQTMQTLLTTTQSDVATLESTWDAGDRILLESILNILELRCIKNVQLYVNAHGFNPLRDEYIRQTNAGYTALQIKPLLLAFMRASTSI